ncbi:hypothetical protein MXB_5465 [Myxobolus squamalis]|nr:hypothetical protein MXB_5465 [Myxobolus squamalis]
MAFVIEAAKDAAELSKLYEHFSKQDHEPLQLMQREYCELMKNYEETQKKLQSALSLNVNKLQQFKKSVKRLSSDKNLKDEKNELKQISIMIDSTFDEYREYSLGLPKKPSWFLRKCIGDIDISLYWKKYNYKDAYENLKMNETIFSLVLWMINLVLFPYSSLTLQENILVANGSRIMLWWRLHHYISILGSGIVMIWPNSFSYQSYRPHYYTYSAIQALAHIVQYSYQKRILYRLRTLGVTSSMALTVDGFSSFMWNGFAFLIIILSILYIFQIYNAYILYRISRSVLCHEIHPLMLSVIFITVFAGNLISVVAVIYLKVKQFLLKAGKKLLECED